LTVSHHFFYNLEEMEVIRMDLSALEQQVLLAVIGLHPNAYGVSIADHIERRTGHEPSVGSIYAAIDRLEQKGYVKSRHGETTPERGGKRKLYITITAPGEVALRQAWNAIVSLRRGIRWGEAWA
jgi:DNA-binding PadR family transcriptional regulator